MFSSVGTDDSSSISKIYIKTLKKAWSIAETPYPKRALHFPSILSQEEVTQLIDAALTPYHRILVLTLYATGVRNAELTHLEVEPIVAEAGIQFFQRRWGNRLCQSEADRFLGNPGTIRGALGMTAGG